MPRKFVVKKKEVYYEAINTSIHMDKKIADAYDIISQKTGYSRNKLMCMALSFALKILNIKKFSHIHYWILIATKRINNCGSIILARKPAVEPAKCAANNILQDKLA